MPWPKKKSLFVRNIELLDETGAMIFSAKNEKFDRVQERIARRLHEKGLEE